MDYLTIITPDGIRFRHDLGGSAVRIGRASDNDVVLQDSNVSRIHAEIVRRREGCFLIDAKSHNGTFLNNRRVTEPALLNRRDRVRIGATTLVFSASDTAPVHLTGQANTLGPETTFIPSDELQAQTPHDIVSILRDSSQSGDAKTDGEGLSTPPVPPVLIQGVSPAQAGRISDVLLEADRELAPHLPLKAIFEKVMDLAQRGVPYEQGLLIRFEGDDLVQEVVRPTSEEVSKKLSVSRAIIQHVRRTRESVLTSDALSDPRFRSRVSIREQQTRSLMCVPLLINKEVDALIYLDSQRHAGLFTKEDLRVLTFLAHIAAIKIENARLFVDAAEHRRRHKEFIEAAAIQRRLLPSEAPTVPGYQLDGSTYPCHEIGGDFYDYITLPGDRLGIGLGDVAGKGLPAALLMSNFLASLRACSELDLPVDRMMERLNRLLCRCFPDNRFVTFFYAALDPSRHALTYVNSAHCRPYIVRQGAGAERLAPGGRPLGMDPDLTFKAGTVRMKPGDMLVCFSDGLTEARNSSEEWFGEEKLQQVILDARDRPPREALELIVTAADSHCGGSRHQDDLTLVILRRSLS